MQERTQEKVQRILDVTADLIARMPLDQITTSHIAKAAGVSLSTLYRFFPHKDAIIEGLLTCYIDQWTKDYTDFLATAKPVSAPELLSELIDIRVNFLRRQPAFRILWIDGSPTPAILGRLREASVANYKLGKEFLSRRFGIADTAELDRKFAISHEITNQMLKFIFAKKREEQEGFIEELKVLLTRYFFPA